jgi:putative transposase
MKRAKPWQRVRPLIPKRPAHPQGGQPAQSDRQMLSAIVYVRRTVIQWNALPRERGACTTVYDRFRLWEEQGWVSASGTRETTQPVT